MTDMTAEELKTYLKEMIPEHDHKCQAYTQLVALIEQHFSCMESAKALKTGEGILTREEVFEEQQKEDSEGSMPLGLCQGCGEKYPIEQQKKKVTEVQIFALQQDIQKIDMEYEKRNFIKAWLKELGVEVGE